MNRLTCPIAATSFVFALTLSSLARADQASESQAAATALFNDARALLTAGKTPEACDKFAMSLRFDKRVGTLLNLADCYEKLGKTASAWGRFNEAAALAARAQQEERVAFAKEHAAKLEPKLARITIVLRAQTPGIVVKRDDVAIAPETFGVAIPVDPGTHHLIATAPLRKPWSVDITIANEAKETPVLVPVLEVDSIAVARADEDRKQRTELRFWTGQRIAGAALAVAGIAGVGIGTGFGISAANQWSDAKGPNHCDATGCDAQGISEARNAQTAGTISTVGFVAGGALLAGGAALFFTGAQKSKTEATGALRVAPLAGPGAFGALLQGYF